MNNKQIAFIVYTNNQQYYNECVKYINDLNIPDNYSIDIIGIPNITSVAASYNIGMKQSNAKYKVYLHQDTFIINKNFIFDLLDVFKDESVGMFGTIGIDSFPSNADFLFSWNIGKTLEYNLCTVTEKNLFQDNSKPYIPVMAIDNFIMATQYDIPWQEHIFDELHFYNIAHSIEMRKKGFQVVVPYQEHSWCHHDFKTLDLEKYDEYRLKTMNYYPEIFPEHDAKKLYDIGTENNAITSVKMNLIKLFETHRYDDLLSFADDIRPMQLPNIEICEITNLMEIYRLECDSETPHSTWFSLKNWEEIYWHYTDFRFTLLRADLDYDDNRIHRLKKVLSNNEISKDAFRKTASSTLLNTSKVWDIFYDKINTEPLVSVIVPIYNGANFVKETLDSIINQTYKNLEIIAIDDASTDNTREILDSYTDKRMVKIYQNENKNICYSSNHALKKATGKYIALIGHDDIWNPYKIEQQVRFLEEHPAYGACFTWVNIIDEHNSIVNDIYNEHYTRFCHDNTNSNKQLNRLITRGNFLCAPSALIRNDLLKITGFYRYGLLQLQDYDLWLRILNISKIYTLQEKLTYYRRFSTNNINLSSSSPEISIRIDHEGQYIRKKIIDDMTDSKFIDVFRNEFIDKNACDTKQLYCERIFLLYKLNICSSIERFIELFEDEDCLHILETKYNCTPNNFYQLNSTPMLFDHYYYIKASQYEQQ